MTGTVSTMDAVARYRAMSGQVKNLSADAARMAKLDQRRYADRYVVRKRGRAVCAPLHMIRFLVDVCGLSLREASIAAREAMRAGDCGNPVGGDDAREVAQRLYRETGDVFEAVALTRFYAWSLDDRARWEEVRSALSAGRFCASGSAAPARGPSAGGV